jgi:hypothetical protein
LLTRARESPYKKSKRGFLLDEARLRKIKDVVEGREAKQSDTRIVYRVYRGDSYSYETESVDDVINEDNEDWRRITRLDLKISHGPNTDRKPEKLAFLLSFSDKDGCELHIAADDRDRVFLLFSDLREYIQHEVTTTRRVDKETGRFLGLLVSMGLLVGTLMTGLFIAQHFDPELSKKALDSTDVNTKLNFLIRHRDLGALGWKGFAGMVLGLMLSLAALFGSGSALVSLIFPGNEFLFGRRKDRFEKRQRLTANLLWGVGVALVVSVVAGLNECSTNAGKP